MPIRATDSSLDVKPAPNTSDTGDAGSNHDSGGSSTNNTFRDNGMSTGVTAGISVCAVLLLVVSVVGMRMCSRNEGDDDKELRARENVVMNDGYAGPSTASSTDLTAAQQEQQQQEQQQSTSTANATLASTAAAQPGELIYVVASPAATYAQLDSVGSGASTSAAPVYASFVGKRNKGGGGGGGAARPGSGNGLPHNVYDVLDATRGRAATAPPSLPSHDNYFGYTVSSGPGAGAPAAIMYAIPMEEEEEEVDGAYAVPATQYGVDAGAFC